jgi:hypothetical protein
VVWRLPRPVRIDKRGGVSAHQRECRLHFLVDMLGGMRGEQAPIQIKRHVQVQGGESLLGGKHGQPEVEPFGKLEPGRMVIPDQFGTGLNRTISRGVHLSPSVDFGGRGNRPSIFQSIQPMRIGPAFR